LIPSLFRICIRAQEQQQPHFHRVIVAGFDRAAHCLSWVLTHHPAISRTARARAEKPITIGQSCGEWRVSGRSSETVVAGFGCGAVCGGGIRSVG